MNNTHPSVGHSDSNGVGGGGTNSMCGWTVTTPRSSPPRDDDDKRDEGGEREIGANTNNLRRRRQLAIHFSERSWDDIGICSCRRRDSSASSSLQNDDDSDADGVGEERACNISCCVVNGNDDGDGGDSDNNDEGADQQQQQLDINLCILERLIELHIVESSSAPAANVNSCTEQQPTSLSDDAPWRSELRHLVSEIRTRYNPVPFHSYYHATHVTLSANRLMAGLQQLRRKSDSSGSGDDECKTNCIDNGNSNSNGNGNNSFSKRGNGGNITNSLEGIAFVYTALIHDVSHVGISNEQLELEDHPIKQAYSNPERMRSYSECNSVDIGLDLLLGNNDDDDEGKGGGYDELRTVLFGVGGGHSNGDGISNGDKAINVDKEDGAVQTFTAFVRHLVMATDIASKERRELGMERFERSFDKLDVRNLDDDEDNNDDLQSFCSEDPSQHGLKPSVGRLRQWTAFEQLVQLADVSHLTQSWETFILWNGRLYAELVEAYRRRMRELKDKTKVRRKGDMIIPPHPSEGWYQGQIDFYDFYVIPLTERVQRLGALSEDVVQSVVENAKENRSRWVKEGRIATERIISSAASVGGGSVSVSLHFLAEQEGEGEERLAEVNFGEDDVNNDNDIKAIEQNAIRASIERLGCHIPICVARYLGEEGNKALFEKERQEQSSVEGGASAGMPSSDQSTVATKGSEGSSKWSWKRSKGGSSGSVSLEGSFRLGGISRIGCKRLSDVSEGSNSSDLMLRTDTSSLPDSAMGPLFPLPLPAQPYCQAALLLVDISGFTRLSTLLDVESLSRVINSYFEELLREVQRYGGDVLKFAGDAFFCAWTIPSSDNDEQKESQDVQERLGQVCVNAALCGAAIVSKFTSYHIAGLLAKDATLSVHCGLGAGTISMIHVGDNSERREFLFLGDPVKQVADAIECAGLGELTASSFVRECLESSSGCRCNFDSSANGEPCVIARRSERFFDLGGGQHICVDITDSYEKEDSCLGKIVSTTENIDVLRRQMKLYVHPSARHDRGITQPMGRRNSRRESAARNQVLASAELRRVFTMFVKPDVDPTLTFDKEKDDALFALLNDIMNITQQCLKRFKGHLRQFIIDDKGVVLILSWGQRGATFGNLVAEKGLPAAIALQDAFQFELNIDCRIGATFGKAYCGVVGGNDRHEFAILGPSVNLAARLACSNINEGILVDDAVRKAANDSFDFFTLEPVFAKGYDGLVPIFEPQAAIERRWKSVDHFVGREPELEKLVRVARRQLASKSSGKGSTRNKPNLALIQAHSGLGKSSFAMQAVETIRKFGSHFRTDVTVVRNICRDGEEFVPFSVFRKIILDLLIQKNVEESDVEDDNSLDISALTFDENSMVDGISSDAIQLQRLRSLCAEMNYNDGIAIWLGYHLFDLSLNMEKDILVTDDSKISPEEAVAFIADAFLTCVSSLDFVLLDIDDAHNLDELSWQVLDQLLKRGKNNLTVLVTSRPLESAGQAQKVQPILEGLREDKRLTELSLKPFLQEDVRELLAKSVGCDGRLIDKQVLQVVFEQSGGMPFFCTEMIKDIIEQDLTEVRDDGSVGWRDSKAVVQKGVYSNMNDFLLHRLDRLSLHGNGRELLQLCAILGLEFTLSELLLARFKGWPSKSEVNEILRVLSDADKDAILNQTCQTGMVRLGKRSSENVPMNDLLIGLTDRTFMFPHSMWRDCLLGTMLKERRQYLHRSVATRMEEEFMQHDDKLDHRLLKMYLKIFLHWNESGNLIKATNLAKRIGKHLASLQLHQQSLDVCMEAMNGWKRDGDAKKDEEEHIGGIPLSVIMRIDTDDLVCLAQLHIAIARNPLLYYGGNYDASYYLNCREILRRAPAASKMEDRSVFFTLYSGTFLLYKNKYIKDEDGSALQRMASDFVEQATLQGDPIHIARALAMEGLTLGLAGKYEKALEVQKKLEEVYSPELSEGICREYTSDRAAQNFGYSVLWYYLLDRHAEADCQIDYIINELMPKMDQRDVHNAFVILLPLVWVLLDKGDTRRAESTFLQYVCDNYDKFYGDDSSSSTYYFYLYKPLRFLLRLAYDTEEMDTEEMSDDAHYKDIESWIFSEDFCTIQRYLASYMCALGKDSNCILAEICHLLASDRSRSFSEERREQILRKGLDHAHLSMQDTEGQKGYDYARQQIVKIKRRLESALEKE